jgi:uncharacterized protein YhbP (UPF0306 family)
MTTEQLIRVYLQSNKVMQLATDNDGQPWLSTVNYAVDEKLNLYWMSLRNTRHSQELRNNQRAAAAILEDPNIKRCLHIEGDALSGDEATQAHELYGVAYGQKEERLAEAQSNDPNTRTYYVLKPRLFVLFDVVNFPDNPRQEWRP